MAQQFRLVNCYNLARYIKVTRIVRHIALLMADTLVLSIDWFQGKKSRNIPYLSMIFMGKSVAGRFSGMVPTGPPHVWSLAHIESA